MMNAHRVAEDVGTRLHLVAIESAGRQLLAEFQINHGHTGCETFFVRIGQRAAIGVRFAMEGYSG